MNNQEEKEHILNDPIDAEYEYIDDPATDPDISALERKRQERRALEAEGRNKPISEALKADKDKLNNTLNTTDNRDNQEESDKTAELRNIEESEIELNTSVESAKSKAEMIRERNRTALETPRSKGQSERWMISSELKCLMGKRKNAKEYAKELYKCAVEEHAGWAFAEIGNRVEGKVKDTLSVDMSIKDYIPNQIEQSILLDKFRKRDDNQDIPLH